MDLEIDRLRSTRNLAKGCLWMLNTHLKTDDGGRFIEQPIQNPLVPAHPHGPVLTFSKTLILFHTHQKKRVSEACYKKRDIDWWCSSSEWVIFRPVDQVVCKWEPGYWKWCMISNPVLVLVLSLSLTTKTCSWVLIQDPFFIFFQKIPLARMDYLAREWNEGLKEKKARDWWLCLGSLICFFANGMCDVYDFENGSYFLQL